ncbi:hypothetical protein FRC08_012194 [Ceratobasidium sp. 394]|nr:hypothetical protein FRC08_012194 [Ceratobasidium sp. 394]
MENAPDLADESAPSTAGLSDHAQEPLDLPHLPDQPAPLVGVAALEDALDSMRASSLLYDTPPVSPNRWDERGAVSDDDQDNRSLDVGDEIDREYPFDQLLDEPGHGDLHNYLAELDRDLEHDEQPEHDFDLHNVLYDEDFGLGNDGAQHADAVRPVFQFTLDEDVMPEPDGDSDNEDNIEAQCMAFQEPDLIRNAYIDAFVQKSLYGATHRALRHQLKAACRTIAAHPDIHAEDISKMAQTIGTAEKRLGVNTDHIITTFTLCPVCKRRYSPEYIAETDNDRCINPDCLGILFTTCKLASGSERRVSNLSFPFASPIAWLKHMLSLPGVSELLQTWRTNEGDEEGLAAPVPCEDWMQRLDINKPIGDIHEGWGWRSTEAGLERYEDPDTGNVVDRSPLDPPVRFVSLPYGLSLSLNTDW